MKKCLYMLVVISVASLLAGCALFDSVPDPGYEEEGEYIDLQNLPAEAVPAAEAEPVIEEAEGGEADIDEQSPVQDHTATSIGENWTEEDEMAYREAMREQNESFAYKDTLDCNIEVDDSFMGVDVEACEWFRTPSNLAAYYNVYQMLVYGIDKYYEGDVPCKFSCSVPEDIIEQKTNMIFLVSVAGEDGRELQVLLDMFNYQINITEPAAG